MINECVNVLINLYSFRFHLSNIWLCAGPSYAHPRVMQIKFLVSEMVLEVVNSEGQVMPFHFFQRDLRLKIPGYIVMLGRIVKPWIDLEWDRKSYVFQQEAASAQRVVVTQD